MKSTQTNQGEVSSKLAQQIAKSILKMQSRIANYLNERALKYSFRKLLLCLIGFCSLFGAYCLYLLLKAII